MIIVELTVQDALEMMEKGYRLEISGGMMGEFIKEDEEC